MTVLNNGIEFLTAQLAKEFIGSPEKKFLDAGTKICKRVASNSGFNPWSEWWVLKSDWDEQLKRCAAIAVTPAQMVRAKQAVREDWQANLEQVVFGQLLKPVYGWLGRAKWQPNCSIDPVVTLIGGGQQICIPNLTPLHIRVLHALPDTP